MVTEILRATGTVFLLSLAAFSLGQLLRRFLPISLTPGERMALSCLAGFGILGLALFLIGMYRLDSLVVWLTVGAALLIGVPSWIRNRTALWSSDEWNYPFELGAAAIVVLIALSSFALPTGNSDDISYHLLGPKTWLAEGRVTPVLHNSHTSFPSTVEMLFTSAIAMGGYRAPGLVTVVLLVVVLFQVRGFALRLGLGQPYASLAVLLTATSPWVANQVGVPFIDIGFAAFVLAAARILLEEEWTNQTALAGGAFCGFACGTKYNGLMLSAFLAVSALARSEKHFVNVVNVRRIAVAAIIAALVAAPWYVRNFLVLGSPIYPPPPFLDRWLHVQAMPPEAVASFHRYILNWNSKGDQKGVVDFLLLPFRLTFDSASFALWNGSVGPFLLAFFPIGVYFLRRERLALRCLLFGTLTTLGWFKTQQEPRFIICLAALGTVASVAGIAGCWNTLGRLGRVMIVAIVSVSVLAGSAITYAAHGERLRQAFRPITLAERVGPMGAALDWLNRNQTVEKVLIIDGCVKPFFLDKPYFMVRGEYGEQPIADIPNATAALNHIRELGVTHLLSVRCENSRLTGLLPVGRPLEKVFESGPARVYLLHR